MKIARYVLLGLFSCVGVLAEETTAFDKAVEAYRSYQKARHAYFAAIDAHAETRLAWDAYWATDRADQEAHTKAEVNWEKARDANKEVKGTYAIYQTTAYGYDKALHAIEEVRLAFAAREEARLAVDEAKYIIEALDAFEKADDIYFTVLDVFEEAIKKAYEQGESK